jgi:glutamine--fructose-6-phosphate transaminase
MLKEISEQAETIQRAILQDAEVIGRIAEKIREGFGVFFVACGSSYNACLSRDIPILQGGEDARKRRPSLGV